MKRRKVFYNVTEKDQRDGRKAERTRCLGSEVKKIVQAGSGQWAEV